MIKGVEGGIEIRSSFFSTFTTCGSHAVVKVLLANIMARVFAVASVIGVSDLLAKIYVTATIASGFAKTFGRTTGTATVPPLVATVGAPPAPPALVVPVGIVSR